MKHARPVFATAAACLAVGCGGSQEGSSDSAVLQTRASMQGFVLTDFTFEQPEAGPDACPSGFTLNEREHYLAGLPAGQRAEAERTPPEQFLRNLRESGGPDPCNEPTAYEDPGHVTMDGQAVMAGFDLDSVASTPESAGPQACPHQDFTSPSGERNIDNQLWRVLGCIKGYQRGQTIDEYSLINIKGGSRTILLEISGLDEAKDGDEVRVGLYSSPDPIPTDASGNILHGASLQVTDNPQHRNVLRGRLVNGVVEAGPADLRLDFKGQFLKSEYYFRDARIRLEPQPDGSVKGLLGGYWDVEQFYDAYGRQATRSGSYFVGFACPGMYWTLKRTADAHPDPQTGKCTSISTTFRLTGVPAFVINPETKS